MSSFFNEMMKEAWRTGIYKCPECGAHMEFEDDSEDTLVCDNCGHSMDTERYGFTDEEYEDLYPTEDEVEDED